MATLNIKSVADIVGDQITTIQAYCSSFVDTAIGSILRSMCESNAGVVQWIQSLIVTLLVTIRASTCSGDDLDTWLADFSFSRIGAVAATGAVTFARYTASYQALILVGQEIQTTDGTQTYTVTTDTSNAAYDATQAGYVIAAGVASVTVPVTAETAGSAGNASAGTITVISGGIQYVDTVTNADSFTNGSDKETDSAVLGRFREWLASLSKGTREAIGYAISSMQTGVSYSLVENEDYNGNTKRGYFYAVVDDGSGAPTSTFIASANNAIDAVRGFTIEFNVFAPSQLIAAVSMVLTVSSGATKSEVITLVQTAINTYISGLSLGDTLPYSMLPKIAYGASDYVTNVTNITLNGGTADLVATAKQVIRPGTITVS